MLRVKIRQIINGQQALIKLVGGTAADGSPIPAPKCSPRMAYSMWLLRNGITEKLEFVEEQRKQILTEASDPQTIETRLNDLLDVKVEMPNVGKLAVSRLEAEGIELSAIDFMQLDWLLKVDVEPLFETDTEEANE